MSRKELGSSIVVFAGSQELPGVHSAKARASSATRVIYVGLRGNVPENAAVSRGSLAYILWGRGHETEFISNQTYRR